MKAAVFVTFLALCANLYAAEKTPQLPRLTVKAEFPLQYQKASQTVARAIAGSGLHPEEYFADVSVRDGGKILDFELWHETALQQRGSGRGGFGDPSGKCRTALYDPERDEVTKIYSWR
jgi:hypothetical protein